MERETTTHTCTHSAPCAHHRQPPQLGSHPHGPGEPAPRVLQRVSVPAVVSEFRVAGSRVDGLVQHVERIRIALGIDATAIPEVLRQANVSMGFVGAGTLPDQANALRDALGLQ